MIKIGVTVNINSGLFSNGINQNALFLARVLKTCGYDVELICGSKKSIDQISLFEKEMKSIFVHDSYGEFYDIIIQLGMTVEIDFFNKWKLINPNVKLVAYEGGNQFMTNMEKCLFKGDTETDNFHFQKNKVQTPDQVWCVPQQENSNYSFYQYFCKQDKVTVVPFIWDSYLIELSFLARNKGTYKPRNIERCSVMEPNISVLKNSFFPVIVLEKNQKVNPIKEIYLFSTHGIKNSKPFVDFITSTDIFKGKLISVEDRYTTSKILPDHTDFVLSWQWENNLNYLWLDCAWMGYPVVHNGSLCKDVGYYYEGFDANSAVCEISKVVSNHNDIYEEYIKEQREIIKRYTVKNDILIKQYKELIEDLLSDKFRRRHYDWRTNSIY